MPTAQTLKLDDDQLFVLMKFRRVINDVRQPQHDDQFLLRWLRARNWNINDAEKMLRDSLKWREKWEVDTKLTLPDYKPPELLHRYYVSGSCGCDKEGSPVIIIPFLNLDMYGLLHVVTKDDIMRLTINQLEYFLNLAIKNGAYQVTVIIDLEGFSLKQFAYRPAAETVIALIQMYEQNYPEILKKCFIINAPKVFAIAFAVVKNFLNEYTISKIDIIKSDPNKWTPLLLKSIDADQLPKCYGGNLVDPDGDPKCPSKIKYGAKVPKELYTKKAEAIVNDETVTASVKKADKLKLDFICAEKGCYLSWEIKPESYDIKFSVICSNDDENKRVIVPVKKLTDKETEIGVIECEAPATYTVILDNSYSYLRSKKVQYKIKLSPSINELRTVNTLPENTNL